MAVVIFFFSLWECRFKNCWRSPFRALNTLKKISTPVLGWVAMLFLPEMVTASNCGAGGPGQHSSLMGDSWPPTPTPHISPSCLPARSWSCWPSARACVGLCVCPEPPASRLSPWRPAVHIHTTFVQQQLCTGVMKPAQAVTAIALSTWICCPLLLLSTKVEMSLTACQQNFKLSSS